MDAFDERFPQQAAALTRLLVSLIAFRDQYTSSHSARVANYVRAIATELGLRKEVTETVVCAALLHDIGKTGVSDEILLKPDKLSEEQCAWIQQYPVWGWDTLRRCDGLEEVALLVRHQRERVDGSGYPKRLRGKEIPLGSRIIAVADAYDALTTDRPYRRARSQAAALAELTRCSGKQFDAKVVNAFRLFLQRQNGLS